MPPFQPRPIAFRSRAVRHRAIANRRINAAIEAIEPRLFLSGTSALPTNGSATPGAITFYTNGFSPDSGGSASPVGGYTPVQMRSAYGVSSISFNGTVGDGTGETIAIIDAYDDPNAATDLTAFDTQFGLAAPPSFQKLNQSGAASPLPGTDPGGPNNANGTWEEEESLDIEWSHAIAPNASIILYEATNSSSLYTAIQTADANTAVNVMSMSFGGGQFSSESSYSSAYFSKAGITYLSSTGDSGTPSGFPAASVNVVAVGGTALNAPSGVYSSESGWNGSGGGIDTYDAQPSYQTFTVSGKSTTKRTTPDVSIEASPNTGVPIYDSWDFGVTTPWVPGYEGGTSLAAPMWAGLVAIADQGRSINGLSQLGGFSSSATTDAYTLPRLYQLPASNYHDVTTGNNGLAAGVGYDLVTGIGTPIANVLVPDLAGVATITGQVFVDNDGDGIYDGSNTPVSNQPVYLDLNNDGVLDNNEPTATTNSSGFYTFTDEPAGGSVRLTSLASGYTLTSPSAVKISYGATETANFTYQLNVPSQLAFTQQPSASTSYGSVISPVAVSVESANGGIAATFSSTVTLTLNTGTFSTGSNTATGTTVNGVATFSNLQINVVGSYILTATDGTLTSAASNSFAVVKATPSVTWATPAAIAYGTALSSTQLNATANVAGSFVYSPVAGTVLNAGTGQTLSVTFTPTDTSHYVTATGTTTITVSQVAPTVSWTTPAAITYGTALTGTQLNATASVPGSFVYTPASGTVLKAGAGQTLKVIFTPTDATDYSTVNGSVSITVNKATSTLNWSNPATITYGTALSSTQLNATASVPGTFVYNPVSGTVLTVGTNKSLAVTFTPTDTTDYTTATAAVTITVVKASPNITWINPAAISYGTALGITQLDATANVPGTFVYTPGSGSVLNAGANQSLGVVFTPTDASDYTSVAGSASITVMMAVPIVTWANPASITYGTPLSSTQLDATANVSGTFVYTPSAGAVLNPGLGQSLGVVFTPTDTTDYATVNASALISVTSAINLTGSIFYLKLDNSSPQNLDIWTTSTPTGTPAYVQEFDAITSITLAANTGGDSFIADFSHGSIIPSGGLSFTGAGSAKNNSLTVVGTGGNDTVAVPGSGMVTINGQSIGYSGASVGNIYFTPASSTQALTVAGGTITLSPGATGGITTYVFSSLAISSGAELVVPFATSHASRLLIQTGALSLTGGLGAWSSTVDLNNNDLDVVGGSLAVLNDQVKQGFNGGNWQGNGGGIISSAAANDSTFLTALGVIQNSVDGTPTGAPIYGTGTALGLFDGANPASTDVLIKYTYYSDANLDGQVDGSDYTRIDNGFHNQLTGWFNGDFNYDAAINGSDYTLIDNAFNTSGTSLAPQVSTSIAPATQSTFVPSEIFQSQNLITAPLSQAKHVRLIETQSDVLDRLEI